MPILFRVQLLAYLFGVLIICCYSSMVFSNSYGENLKEIYSRISNGKEVKVKHAEATFSEGNVTWTIFGAGQKSETAVKIADTWSVGKSDIQVLVVKDVISDMRILPTSDPVPNALQLNKVSIVGSPGEYEPASIVIRAGDRDLESVLVSATTLKNTVDNREKIPIEDIDVRIVKSWYQSGNKVARRKGDKKILVPELLLHDDSIVSVNHEYQVNLVKDLNKIEDATVLQRFRVASRTNKQIWINIHIPSNRQPGIYKGDIEIFYEIDGIQKIATLGLTIEVLPINLPKPDLEYVLYYLGRLNEVSNPYLDIRKKTGRQMLEEMKDMRAHGLTNITIDHDSTQCHSFKPVEQQLNLMQQAGFRMDKLLYLDWKVSKKVTALPYRNKLLKLKKIASNHGISQVYVYNRDEQKLSTLLNTQSTFQIAHELGLKNFVTIRPRYGKRLSGLLDLAIVNRDKDVSPVRSSDIDVWAYDNPQAGEEKPLTYRKKYGVDLWLDGFNGACNFAYQTSEYPWNDWWNEDWRPHVMAYPTHGAPIPTLQWEGWREAVDDIRYVAALIRHKGGANDITKIINRRQLLEKLIPGYGGLSPSELRRKVISNILDRKMDYDGEKR